MYGLRAAGLIVTGGSDDGGNRRDEVSHKCRFDQLSVWYINVQVLQYEETAGTWSEIGMMEKARYHHAVVEIDVSLCPGIVGQTNKIKLLSLTFITIAIVYHLIMFLSAAYSLSK